MTSAEYIKKRKDKYKRIKEIRKELESLLWNTEEDKKNPSCQDWVAWQNLELRSIRKELQAIREEIKEMKNK